MYRKSTSIQERSLRKILIHYEHVPTTVFHAAVLCKERAWNVNDELIARRITVHECVTALKRKKVGMRHGVYQGEQMNETAQYDSMVP
jgi:hypothetical protein